MFARSWFICVVVLCWTLDTGHSADTQRGLLVTTASQWVNGTTQRVCVVSHQLNNNIDVKIQLQYNNDNNVLSEQSLQLAPGASQCADVPVAFNVSIKQIKLNVTAFSNQPSQDYKFEQRAVINIKHVDIHTFIETDKPIYKPSDKVRIRVLALDGPDLNIVTDPVSLLYIEDPSRTRIMQWKDLANNDGLVEVDMQLSDEPPLGEWTIKATIRQQQHSRTFTVKEYVLPKFEVTVIPPSYVSNEVKEISWQVCARYTYGESVTGHVTLMSVCRQEMYQANEQCLQQNKTQLTDGCALFQVNSSLLQLPMPEWRVYGAKLVFTAQVTERGTDVALNGTNSAEIGTREMKIEMTEGNSNFFKPGLDYTAKGKVTFTDGSTHRRHIEVFLTESPTSSWSETITTDRNGKFEFIIPAAVTWANRNNSLNVGARRTGNTTTTATTTTTTARRMRESVSNLNLKPWFSPSHNYIQIQSAAGTLKCRSLAVLAMSVMMEDGLDGQQFAFVYQLMSRGNIVAMATATSQLQLQQTAAGRSVYNVSLSVNVTTVLSGSVDVLVFYVRADGETVADSKHFKVQQCFNNQVEMSFSSSRVQPGHVTQLRIKADRSSLCAVAVVDKSIELMGSTAQLTTAKLGEIVKSYELWKSLGRYPFIAMNNNAVCQKKNSDSDKRFIEDEMMRHRRHRQRRMVYPGDRYFSNFVDSKEAFLDTGLTTLTDLTIETRPCQQHRWMLYSMSYEMGLPLAMSRENLRGPAAPPGAPILTDDADDEMESGAVNTIGKAPAAKPVLHRTFFPETWLWNLERVGESGVKEVSVNLPHTITEWVGNGFCVNKHSSVGVVEPFRITVFQPFFISFTLPYSMIRGETVNVPVSVFNYLSNTCLLVSLSVEKNKAFQLLNNETRSTQNSVQLTVCGRSTETHTFRIVPQQIGQINFTVHATSAPSESLQSNTVDNIESATAEDKVTRQLLVLSEGKEEEYTQGAYVCSTADNSSTGSWSLTLPPDVINDSVRTRINVIGDIMGPALGGLDQLLRLPTGCGEQNMLLFAPNIYVLEYLTNTDQLTPSLREKALGFMCTGYQRELTYRHSDGSYSAFGQSDPEGSIWLTAFVVRSFARAQPFIFIDNNDLDMSIKWIKSHQMENGCFRLVGKVLHKEMKGGLHSDSPTGLTAYIVISLLEANVSATDAAVMKAMECLSIQSVDDVYTLSLMTYAYSLYGRDAAVMDRIKQQLDTKAVHQGGMTHWAQSPVAAPENTDMWWDKPKSADVEMTSYILTAKLINTDQSTVSTVLPIVRWLTTQRNQYGGFASTQDTVVALQALSKFASLVYSSQRDSSVSVTLVGQGLGKTGQTLTVNADNRLVQQSIDNKLRPPTTLTYTLTGTGCALVQAGVKFNKESVQRDVEQPPFMLSVSVVDSNKCKTQQVQICVRYSGSDAASNMAVVAVNMVSGWIPDKASIHKLKNNARLGLKRYDIDKNIVQLYFDEFDKVERCLTITVEQTIEVSDTRPALVHVYDYYQPGSSVFAEYNFVSDQCPSIKAAAPAALRAPALPPRPTRGPRNDRPRGRTTKQPRTHQHRQIQCPVCNSSVEATQQLLCSSNYAYRVTVKRHSTMKLLTTLKTTESPVTQWNTTTIKYNIKQRCSCSLLRDGTNLLLATASGLEVDSKHRRRLTLNLMSSTTNIFSDSTDMTPCNN